MENNISFTSKIVFVNPEKFSKVFNTNVNEKNFVRELWNLQSVRHGSDWLGTANINNCTAFNINGVDESLMGHFMTSPDNLDNKKDIKTLIKDFISTHKIKSAMMIGSKSPTTPVADFSSLGGMISEEYIVAPCDKNSRPLFSFIKKVLLTTKPTIFQEHKHPNTCSHYVHDTKNDVTYVCTYIDTFKNQFVKNEEDLNKAFENIRLSENDTIEFVA